MKSTNGKDTTVHVQLTLWKDQKLSFKRFGATILRKKAAEKPKPEREKKR